MALLKNMKSTAISTLGEKFENVGGPALVALLTTIDPAVGSTAVAIGGLLSYGSSHRSKLKQEYLAIQIRKSLEAHAADISHINENLHEAVALAIEGVQSAVSKEKIERFAKIVAGTCRASKAVDGYRNSTKSHYKPGRHSHRDFIGGVAAHRFEN